MLAMCNISSAVECVTLQRTCPLIVSTLLQDWEEGDGKYVAPELLSADIEPTPAADIYSLGATLYECATGKAMHLFTGPFCCQAACQALQNLNPAQDPFAVCEIVCGLTLR